MSPDLSRDLISVGSHASITLATSQNLSLDEFTVCYFTWNNLIFFYKELELAA
jgi:hypothetical protein